ncbi:MFS transporter [Staphylococcus massiliensis]|uniref:MFS transporter n=1 Tax=Staphylococcus massiliensis TaxID=555791 RepID=UPI001EE13A5A|nr:MFS transporter [Staphylococcus massiliensis]MCG3412774.1 MFS transporter [Staphylococcus massiliensis]
MQRDVNYVNSASAKRKVIITSMGNALEWFDFALYAQLAVYISANFFPNTGGSENLLYTFGTFALAFLVRPIGAIVFGAIGDKFGRKIVLTTTISIMALSTLLLGVLPTYHQIGIFAPILLLLVRMAQSFSTGGEYSGAMTYIVESSPDKKRGRLASGLEMGTMVGNAFAAILVAILSFNLSTEQMEAFGWRIPFILAAPFGLMVFYLRTKLDETPTFKHHVDQKTQSLFKALKNYKKEAFVMLIAVAVLNVNNYMFLTYLPSFLKNDLSMSDQSSTIINAISLLLIIPFIFIFGYLSDKYNNKRLLVIGFILYILLAIPTVFVLNMGNVVSVFIAVMVYAIMLSIFVGIMPSTLPAITHTNVRMKFLSIIYNVATAIFGGATPFILTLLGSLENGKYAPAIFLIITNVIGLVVFIFMFKPTSNKPLKGSKPNVEKT